VLAFAIAFAQMDLDALSPVQLWGVHWNSFAVIKHDLGREWFPPWPVSIAVLRGLQGQTFALLYDVVLRNATSVYELNLNLTLVPLSAGGLVRVHIDGRYDHVLRYRVAQALDAIGTSKVMKCPATYRRKGQPDQQCGRLFLKRTTGEYCSSRCEKRMTMRRNREQE
jgi:hypothetical protein